MAVLGGGDGSAQVVPGRTSHRRLPPGPGPDRYFPLPDEAGQQRYRYAAPAFGFTTRLGTANPRYPGIAVGG
jgi:hypothetical protein